MVIKNPAAGLDAAIAVMRKLGKGDPVAYLRALNWHDIGKQAAGEVIDKINGLRDALKEITDSFILRHTLPDEALAGMQTSLRQLDDITPKITQGMQQAAQEIGQKVNKALDDYQGIKPSSGTVGQPHKTVAKELAPPKGNELPGAKPVKRIRNPILDKHYEKLAEYEARYQKRLDEAIKNGDSAKRIGAFKAKLTEAKGERAASAYMEKHFAKPPPPAQMELGFGPGPGVDQIWAKRDENGKVIEYFIVEAKGPGAKLQKTSKGFTQMDDRWIKMNLERMKKSKKYPERNQLGQELLNAKSNRIKTNKLVIEAIEENGNIIGGKLQPLPITRG